MCVYSYNIVISPDTLLSRNNVFFSSLSGKTFYCYNTDKLSLSRRNNAPYVHCVVLTFIFIRHANLKPACTF